MNNNQNNNQKILLEDANGIFKCEDLLIRVNRLSHFMEHDTICRHDIFKKALYINFYSYFLDDKAAVESLVNRLSNKIKLLTDPEYKVEDISTLAYIKRIWSDIFILLELFQELIQKSIKRFRQNIPELGGDFIISEDDYQKTQIIRELEKLERTSDKGFGPGLPNDNSWFLDGDLSHGLI